MEATVICLVRMPEGSAASVRMDTLGMSVNRKIFVETLYVEMEGFVRMKMMALSVTVQMATLEILVMWILMIVKV